MKSINKFLLIFIVAFISMSSINKSSCKNKAVTNDSKGSKIVYVSPSKCLYIIEFNAVGEGKMTYGKATSYEDSIPTLSNVIEEKQFSINAKKMSEVNSIINEIKNSSALKGAHHWDAWHRLFFVGNINKIDVYGLDSQKLEDLFNLISPSLPFKIDYTNC